MNRATPYIRRIAELLGDEEWTGMRRWEIERIVLDAYHAGVEHGMEAIISANQKARDDEALRNGWVLRLQEGAK